jgi:tetratricopeptide (TPR) repeat protein
LRASTISLLAAALISSTSTASAQPGAQTDDERARMHFQAGNAYFQTGEYDAALREFQRSFELSARPALFYNMALVYERLGDLEQAIAHLRRFLAEAPEAEAQRATLEARIANLQPRLEAQQARDAAEAERARRLEVEEQRRREEEQRRAADESSGGLPTLTWVGWIAGAAGLATFAVFGGLTLATASDLEENCVPLGTCTQADVDSLTTYALIADIGLVVGVLGAGLGTLVLAMSGGGEAEAAPPATGAGAAVRLAPWLGPDGAGALARGTF